MSDPIDDTTRAYARTLDAESVEAVLIDIRRLVGLYHEQHGQMERDDRDLLACHIDDLDRWLCAGAPLPPEWAAPVAEAIAPGAIGEALALDRRLATAAHRPRRRVVDHQDCRASRTVPPRGLQHPQRLIWSVSSPREWG